MIITLLTVAIVSASLESTASRMNEVHIRSFLTINDVKNPLDVKHVMMNSAFEGGELIGQLSELLDLPREASIDHFIAKNQPELEHVSLKVVEAIKAPNDLVLASIIATGVLPPSSLIPLQTLISQYLVGKRTMCLYDDLPVGLRDPLEYAKLFKPAENYRVIPEPNPGVLVSLPDDRSPDYTEIVSIGRGILLQRVSGGIQRDRLWKFRKQNERFSRVIDVPGQCAVDLVHPYRDIQFNFEHRAVFAFRNVLSTAYLDVWRADSSIPVQIANVDCEKDFAAVTEDGQFFLFRIRHTFSYMPHASSAIKQVVTLRSCMMATDLQVLPTLESVFKVSQHPVRLHSVVDHFFLQPSTGGVAVLSTEGFQRLLSFFQATDGSMKEKLDALDALIKKREYRSTRAQSAVTMLRRESSLTAHWLNDMNGLGDITLIPFNEWESWYLVYLDRLISVEL